MASIWKTPISLKFLTDIHVGTAVDQLGIEFTEIGDDYLIARVPVDERTRQPLGLIHGGVSVVLAETIGSCGAAHASPPENKSVGLEINANHIRSATQGWVTGIGRPLHIGRTTHVWEIKMTNDQGKLTCVSRITVAILDSTR